MDIHLVSVAYIYCLWWSFLFMKGNCNTCMVCFYWKKKKKLWWPGAVLRLSEAYCTFLSLWHYLAKTSLTECLWVRGAQLLWTKFLSLNLRLCQYYEKKQTNKKIIVCIIYSFPLVQSNSYLITSTTLCLWSKGV